MLTQVANQGKLFEDVQQMLCLIINKCYVSKIFCLYARDGLLESSFVHMAFSFRMKASFPEDYSKVRGRLRQAL